METIVNRLSKIVPDVQFTKGSTFFWSPQNHTIGYPSSVDGDIQIATWSLLHETGHALLNHVSYSSDLELLLIEVAAWDKAKQLADELSINIDDDHVQDCLDTYRDWLHQRSTCPNCGLVSLQINDKQYRCVNCNCEWYVSGSRFCRPYRLTKSNHPKNVKEKHDVIKTATFR